MTLDPNTTHDDSPDAAVAVADEPVDPPSADPDPPTVEDAPAKLKKRAPAMYTVVDYPEPHRQRAHEILAKHPEVKALFGRNPWTFLLVLFAVASQVAIGVSLAVYAAPWWLILIVAFAVGAFFNHMLWVLVHECAHNLIFPRKWQNQFVAAFCNIPLILPSACSFCIYHLKHHQYQGDPDLDADLPSSWEARLIGNTMIGKGLWEFLFPIFQSLRTARLSSKRIQFMTRYVALNWLVQIGFCVGLFLLGLDVAFWYLLASLSFSIGFHPLGARWIQEHYVLKEGQETYSYYGPLNIPALNVGYHNEHHDFPFTPWHRLPKLKAAAPEYYDSLMSHRSWTALWLRFLFDPTINLFTRIVRDGKINRRRALMPKETYAPDTFDEATEGQGGAA